MREDTEHITSFAHHRHDIFFIRQLASPHPSFPLELDTLDMSDIAPREDDICQYAELLYARL